MQHRTKSTDRERYYLLTHHMFKIRSNIMFGSISLFLSGSSFVFTVRKLSVKDPDIVLLCKSIAISEISKNAG